MIHNLTAGFFESNGAITKPLAMRIVRKLLGEFGEMDADGAPTLGGWKVRFENGCVILPWKGDRTNRVTEAFAARLQEATGCMLADREHGRLVEVGELAALISSTR